MALKAQWFANTTKATERRAFRQERSQKRPQNQQSGNFCSGEVFFSVFQLDGLTRSLKIHTQTTWFCHQHAWVKRKIFAWRCDGGTLETWRYMHSPNSTWVSLIRLDFQQHAVNDMFFWNDMKSWTPRKKLPREDRGSCQIQGNLHLSSWFSPPHSRLVKMNQVSLGKNTLAPIQGWHMLPSQFAFTKKCQFFAASL